MNALILLLWLPFGLALNAWVIACYWEWFIMPGFHLPAVPTPHLLGASILINFITMHPVNTSKDDEEQSAGSVIITGLVVRLLVLITGKIIHVAFV